ncbi:hypothetical protein B1A_21972, partial [mine drainage metagenome]
AMVKMSAYTVGSYNSFGTLTNVSYTSGSTNNQTELASAIYVNGSSMGASPSNIENEKVTFLSISNETLIGMTQPKAFLIATAPSITSGLNSKTSMQFDLTSKATQLGTNMNLSFGASLGNLIQFNTYLKMSMKGYTIYKISNGSFNGYFITNGNATLLSNGMKISIKQATTTMLLSGFISNGNLKNVLEKYFGGGENEHKFTYNNTTNSVTGEFVSFNFSQKNGDILNLTGTFKSSSTEVFSSISVTGNGSFGSTQSMTSLPMNQVVTIGSVFFYANNSFIYVLHNNPSMESSFAISNGTMTMILGHGLNATSFLSTGASVSQSAYNISENQNEQNN